YMFALGCIQSLSCHTNTCPTGVATQDKLRQRALVVPDKAERVRRYHARTVRVLADMLAAGGIAHPDELKPHHVFRRVTDTQVLPLADVLVFLKPGSLLDGSAADPYYTTNWHRARAESFDPVM
ncbi:MAG: glutamate synthase-related protein, partial [Sphingomonas sp.]